MNNGDGKNTNNDSDNSAPQGIFSTPELTVDTEKITPAQDSANSKARVASFFANTDASRQAEQVQNAMTTPANYATEDLVINNGGKKKRSFLPIIIAVVAILAVVGGVTAYFLISNVSRDSVDPLTAFNDFREYLENGPNIETKANADSETSTNADNSVILDGDWYVFEINNTGMSPEDQQRYFNELWERYDKYLSILGRQDDAQQLTARSEEYIKTLKFTVKLADLDSFNNEIIKIYVNDGANAAYQYVENESKAESENYIFKRLSDYLRDYLSVSLSITDIYAEHDCIEGDGIYYICEEQLSSNNATYREALGNRDVIVNDIYQLYPSVVQSIKYETELIGTKLEELYGAKH